MPRGSRPASSANMQNSSWSRKWATAWGACPRPRSAMASAANSRAASSVSSWRVTVGRSASGLPKSGAQDAQRLRRRRGQVVEREGVDLLGGAREVGVDLEALEVAHDQQGRVAQVLAVVVELPVGVAEVGALALVLPGEAVLHPHVGEAIATAELLGALLEREPFARRVEVGRGAPTEHVAEVAEVRLSGGALGERAALPLGGELGGVHRARWYRGQRRAIVP